MHKETYNRLLGERLNEIQEISKKKKQQEEKQKTNQKINQMQ